MLDNELTYLLAAPSSPYEVMRIKILAEMLKKAQSRCVET